jgi:hypothetical protein
LGKIGINEYGIQPDFYTLAVAAAVIVSTSSNSIEDSFQGNKARTRGSELHAMAPSCFQPGNAKHHIPVSACTYYRAKIPPHVTSARVPGEGSPAVHISYISRYIHNYLYVTSFSGRGGRKLYNQDPPLSLPKNTHRQFPPAGHES